MNELADRRVWHLRRLMAEQLGAFWEIREVFE